MDVDDDTIIEIKENTAVTREKIEYLDEKLDNTDSRLEKHGERLDEHQRRLAELRGTDDLAEDNSNDLSRIKGIGALLALLASLLVGLHGWIVPLL